MNSSRSSTGSSSRITTAATPQESSREVVFLVDPEQDKIVGVTNGIHQLIGLETIDIVGRGFSTLLANGDSERPLRWNSGETFKLAFQGADRSVRTFDVTFRPMHANDHRHMKMAVLHVPDSVEFQTTAEPHELQLIESQALHALQHKPQPAPPFNDKFFSKVSHQIRTPLGIILSSAGILGRYNKDFSDDQRQEYIHSITDSVQRITNLLDDFVWLGKLQSGNLTCQPKPENLLHLCHQTIEEVRTASAKPIPITLHHTDIPSEVLCDESLLHLALMHLLGNAIKFAINHHPIVLLLRRQDTLCHIEITDNGIGILPADHEHLFQPFHRGANCGEIPGNGLGLAIVHQCIHLHGGTITYTSSPRHGTTFHITLPLFEPNQ